MACLIGHSHENNKYSTEYIVKVSVSTMAILEEKFNVQKKYTLGYYVILPLATSEERISAARERYVSHIFAL